MSQPAHSELAAGFLARLAQQPLWLLGVAIVLAGFGMQAAALGLGRLIVVQPIQVISVVFALPLGARLTGQRVGRREIAGAALVTGGLIAFLVLIDPSGGKEDAPVGHWLIAGGIVVAISVVVFLTRTAHASVPARRIARRGRQDPLRRPAALTKATVDLLGDGLGAVVTDWHVYALARSAERRSGSRRSRCRATSRSRWRPLPRSIPSRACCSERAARGAAARVRGRRGDLDRLARRCRRGLAVLLHAQDRETTPDDPAVGPAGALAG